MEKSRFLITGGSRGIGAAIVKLAREDGHEVVFTGRNEEGLEIVSRETGGRAFQADITKAEENRATVEFCKDRMGGIDVLVNNAASLRYWAPLGNLETDRVREMFEVNVFGLIDLTNRVAPLMVTQKSGAIVNIASTSGLKGDPNATAYAGTKFALRGITECWRGELRPHNIRVMLVCPSAVQTMWGGPAAGGKPNHLYAEDIAHSILAALEMHPRGFIPEFAVFATNPFE